MRNNRTVVDVGASHRGCSISEQRAVRTLLRRDKRWEPPLIPRGQEMRAATDPMGTRDESRHWSHGVSAVEEEADDVIGANLLTSSAVNGHLACCQGFPSLLWPPRPWIFDSKSLSPHLQWWASLRWRREELPGHVVCTQSAWLSHIKLPPKPGEHESRAPPQPPHCQGEEESRGEDQGLWNQDTDRPSRALPLPCCVTSQTHLTTLCPCFLIWSVSSVQSLSRVRLFVTPWTAARQASLSITNPHSLLKLKSIESVMPSNHLILCCLLLLLPSIFPSIRVFSKGSVLCIRWPNIRVSVSASVLPMNIQDWFPLGQDIWLVAKFFSPRDSQESSPTPQFKSINP